MNSEIKKESVVRAGTRVVICGVGGIVGAMVVGSLLSWRYAPLAAWDIAALIFLAWMFATLNGRDAEQTQRLAMREDPGHAASDIVLVFASVASLAAIGMVLAGLREENGSKAFLLAAFSIVSVIFSWATVHVVYLLRYAREYYANPECIDFNSKHAPRYSDFAYMSFTIGMTFQVSDTNIKSNKIRRVIMRHALLSYLFGTFIVAAAINLIAGFGR